MGSTYYSLRYHFICATKERRPFLRKEWRLRVYEYFGGTVRGLGGVALRVGGVEDHLHALIALKPTHNISDFVRELKKATSVWIKQHFEQGFEWQEGYSIFGVSTSVEEKVKRYIDGQEEHHLKRTFMDELRELLARHAVKYDQKYLG